MSRLSAICDLIQLVGIDTVIMEIKNKLRGSLQYNKRFQQVFDMLSPKHYPRILQDIWEIRMGSMLNLDHPRSFNEGIQWIKLHDITPLMTKLADKYLVRSWISEKIGDQYLIPLLGVWASFESIDFDELPNQFVLKCNHGCGMNLVVKDKSKLDYYAAKRQFDQWMSMNYAYARMGLELQYKDIPRKIIAEQYIEQMNEDLLDFKIHCFRGEPQIIQVIGNRDIGHHKAKEAFFDLHWKSVDLKYHTYDEYKTLPRKPVNLDELINLSRILCNLFI